MAAAVDDGGSGQQLRGQQGRQRSMMDGKTAADGGVRRQRWWATAVTTM